MQLLYFFEAKSQIKNPIVSTVPFIEKKKKSPPTMLQVDGDALVDWL